MHSWTRVVQTRFLGQIKVSEIDSVGFFFREQVGAKIYIPERELFTEDEKTR